MRQVIKAYYMINDQKVIIYNEFDTYCIARLASMVLYIIRDMYNDFDISYTVTQKKTPER